MFPAIALAAAPESGPPPPDPGRAFERVLDPSLDGSGPGASLVADADRLGADGSSLEVSATAALTLRPIRVAVAFPTDVGPDTFHGRAPSLSAELVVFDRRRLGVGLAAAVDLQVTDLRPVTHLSLGAGKAEAVVVDVAIGKDAPPEFRIGGTLPIVAGHTADEPSVLSAFAELDGAVSFRDFRVLPGLAIGEARAGLHLAPIPPLVIGASAAVALGDDTASARASVTWIPPRRASRPRTSGPDRDHDGVENAVDTCPRDPEDVDGGNDADGCPDRGSHLPGGGD